MTLTDKVKTMAHCAIGCGLPGAVDWSAEIIGAIEKQEPRKPNGFNSECWGCGNHLLWTEKYCSDCGQAIDWEDEK